MKKLFPYVSFSFLFISLITVSPLAHATPTAVDMTALASYVGNTTSNTPGTETGQLATGDFNCDGEDDVIIGASGYSSGKGRIYAIWGGAPFLVPPHSRPRRWT